MDDRDRPFRAPPDPTPVWLGLIVALALIFAASLTRAAESGADPAANAGTGTGADLATEPAAEPATYTGTVEPCFSGHGDRDLYRAGLTATGWTDLPDEARPNALDMLSDAYLPIILGVDQPLEALVARRAEARLFWEDLARNRTLMGRDGQVLLLAGFLSPDGKMIVECWVAGPETTVTDDMMTLIGATYEAPGIRMAQVNLPAADTRPPSELFVSRLSLQSPTLAATDALRTRITFTKGADL
jgi:hypothetical protein